MRPRSDWSDSQFGKTGMMSIPIASVSENCLSGILELLSKVPDDPTAYRKEGALFLLSCSLSCTSAVCLVITRTAVVLGMLLFHLLISQLRSFTASASGDGARMENADCLLLPMLTVPKFSHLLSFI